MIGPLFRFVFAWPYRVVLAGLYRAGVRPWMLTAASVLTNVVVAWLLVRGDRLLPGLLLLPAGLFDIFDGGVARLRGEESRWGAFLDSVMDRVCDALLLGALYWTLRGEGLDLPAALALAGLAISLLVSHIRAEAEGHGVTMTEGFFQRLDRYVALILGLTIPGALLPALSILVGLGALTVLQRTYSGWRGLGQEKSDKSVMGT